MRQLLAIVLSLTLPPLYSCTTLMGDSLNVEQHLAQAGDFKAKRDYLAAADSLGKAIRKQPTHGNLYLQQGELLEIAERPDSAEKTYRKRLAVISDKEPTRMELIYRLLQVPTLKLSLPDQAQPLLNTLPAGSIQFMDAQGCLAYGRNEHRKALRLFDQARQLARDKDLSARILYHLALSPTTSSPTIMPCSLCFTPLIRPQAWA